MGDTFPRVLEDSGDDIFRKVLVTHKHPLDAGDKYLDRKRAVTPNTQPGGSASP